MNPWLAAGAGGFAAGLGLLAHTARRRNIDRWLGPYLLDTLRGRYQGPKRGDDVHIILAITDHYEPNADGASAKVATERVAHWVREYPRTLREFRDADGRPPQHSFFTPIEDYVPEHLDELSYLCRQGYGEVEVHLHHDRDNAEHLRETLTEAVAMLSARHGLLARRRETGELAYAFIHGNWALNNARPDGCWCGVNDEIRVLRETGCYADFTFPSAPSPTQPPTINRIYYAKSAQDRPRGHDYGVAIDAESPSDDALMLIEGPLLFNSGSRKWGLVPRLENGCIQLSQPATMERLELWLRAGVRVPARPDWYFVKLHAHGAPERDRDMLIGPPAVAFHRALAERAARDPKFQVHYVTAREMYNLAKAAEAGWQGSVAEARDFALVWEGSPYFSSTAKGVGANAIGALK